jgi:hypothetical protein
LISRKKTIPNIIGREVEFQRNLGDEGEAESPPIDRNDRKYPLMQKQKKNMFNDITIEHFSAIF